MGTRNLRLAGIHAKPGIEVKDLRRYRRTQSEKN
jgi:hypothetical protein